MMYFYSFTTYHGFDRIVAIDTPLGDAGDLFLIDGKYMLCLGETVSFPNIYIPFALSPAKILLIEPQLLSERSVSLIHEFVAHRFTTYKNTIPLWITDEIDTLLKRKPSVKKKSPKKNLNQLGGTGFLLFDTLQYDIYTGCNQQTYISALQAYIYHPFVSGQRCIIFPNFWTMWTSIDVPTIKHTSGYIILTSTSTQKQKDDAYWSIKMGYTHTLICTYSQIFQDRYDLVYILIIDHHTWYYKNQQDPKYHTLDVCRSLADKHQARLDMTGINLIM